MWLGNLKPFLFVASVALQERDFGTNVLTEHNRPSISHYTGN